MKKLIPILLCYSYFCFGGEGFTISGTVKSPRRNYVICFLHDPLSSLRTPDTVRVNGLGRFEHMITGHYFFTVYLEVDSTRKLLVNGYNGESLNLAFGDQEGQVGMTGSMSRIQQFKMVDREYFGKVFKRYATRNPEFEKKEYLRTDGYFKVLDSITHERIGYLNEWFTNPVTPTENAFIKFCEIGYVYDNLFYKQSYPNPPLQKFKFYQDKYRLDRIEWYAFSDWVNFDDADLSYIPEYRRFINSFLIEELGIRRKRHQTLFLWPEVVDSGMRLIDELSSDIKAREGLKSVFLAYITDEIQRDKNATAAMDVLFYIEQVGFASRPFRELKARLTIVIRDNRFRKGSPAPDFQLLDSEGNLVTLGNFRDKKVIIDIAASWCGPCITGIPEWNERVEANKDPKVVYVFLSLDDTQEEWKRFIKKYPAKGWLLFAGKGGFKSKFAKDYEITALPHHIVIDKGKIEVYRE
jgi:thiol-disulfide isomerase/thioredoxin